jgi:flagellar motor switch protein FliN/FliY
LNERVGSALLSLASSWLGGAFDSLSLVVDREIAVRPSNPTQLAAQELEQLHAKFQLAVVVPVREQATSGTACIFMSLKDATVLADLLIEGAGAPADTLSEERKTVLQSALEQMTVAAEAGLKNALNGAFILESPRLVDLAGGKEKVTDLVGSTDVVGVEFALSCDTVLDTAVLFVMSLGIVQQLADKVPSPAQEPRLGDATAAATAQPVAASAQAEPALKVSGMDNINLILDVELSVVARLGQVEMPISDILALGPGSIIEVGRSIEEPVDLLVNDKLIARGEVVVVDERFGLRLTEIVSPSERVKSLG